MNTYDHRPGDILIENWMVEAVHCLLENSYDGYQGDYFPLNQQLNPKHFTGSGFVIEAVMQLACIASFLESIVVAERILVPRAFSDTWRTHSKFLAKLLPDVLTPLSCLDESPEHKELVNRQLADLGLLNEQHKADVRVFHGALFYALLSNEIGTPYLPSPYRADFLDHAERNLRVRHATPTQWTSMRNLDVVRQKAVANLTESGVGITTIQIALPCVFSRLLAESVSKENLIDGAIKLRESREAQAFRRWVNELDLAIKCGSIKEIARVQSELLKHVNDFSNSLKCHETKKYKIQIALSGPSIATDSDGSRWIPLAPHQAGLKRWVCYLLDHWLDALDAYEKACDIFKIGLHKAKFQMYIDYFCKGKPDMSYRLPWEADGDGP